jgi:ABC-type nitrate/sulfonate/bicarbonate transport system substrate-binding protein
MKQGNRFQPISVTLAALLFLMALVAPAKAQQKEMPEVTIATAVSNLAFGALWVAEQLKYFEQEGVRAKITSAGGGSTCQSAVVGRSVNFCASSSEDCRQIQTYAEKPSQCPAQSSIAARTHRRNKSGSRFRTNL